MIRRFQLCMPYGLRGINDGILIGTRMTVLADHGAPLGVSTSRAHLTHRPRRGPTFDNTVDAGRSHLQPIEYSTFVSQVKGTQENDREIAGHRSQCVLLYLTPPIFVTGPA